MEIEAARCLPLRKSNERRFPIKSISMDQRETGSVCFALNSTLSPPLSGEECVSQHFFLMSPMWSVVLSVIHSLSLSLPLSLSLWTPSITRPSERVPWQWCDGATQTVKMDCYPGRFANTHTQMDVWHTNSRHSHTCVHSPIFTHIITHMHDHTITDSAACTHTYGPVNSWACQPKVNLTQCSSWKQAQGGIMASLRPLQHETHTPEKVFFHISNTQIQTNANSSTWVKCNVIV